MKILTLIIAPTFFWAAYHYYKDRHQPEPIANLLLTYGLGIAAGYLGLHAYVSLELVGLRFNAYELAENNRLGLFFYSIFVIGVIEEVVKFIPFWLIGMRLHHFDEPIDGIIYASFVALGFATYENFYYLPHLQGTELVARAITSPLIHVMFASIWGYTCSRAQMRNRPLIPAAISGLAIAITAHGLYDFITIGLSEWLRIFPPVIILSIWIWRMRVIRRLQKHHLETIKKSE
ncbi:PrsW family intramembrane metalloprotease [Kaarinaea lacus]